MTREKTLILFYSIHWLHMDQAEKWTKNMLVWQEKFTKFYNIMDTCSDGKYINELLLDILQDLFSDRASTETKLELLLFLQQEATILIDADKVEQVFGSLLNIYDYLGNHMIHLKSQVLITLTTICINFDMKELKSQSQFIILLLDYVSKVNIAHPLLLKTCANCLYMFEDQSPNILFDHLQQLYAVASTEQSFASFSHLMLLAKMMYNMSEKGIRIPEEEITLGKFDSSKCLSYLVKQLTIISPTCLLQVVYMIFPCFKESKGVPKSVLTSLLDYCGQSWNFLLIFVYITLQVKYPALFQADDLRKVSVISKLLLIQDMYQIQLNQRKITRQWIQGFQAQIPKGPLISETSRLISFELQPKLYETLDMVISKLECIMAVVEVSSERLPAEEQILLRECLCQHSKYVKNVRETSNLFYGFYNLYKSYDEESRIKILRFIEALTISSIPIVLHAINFWNSVEDFSSMINYKILENITIHNLKQETSEILLNLTKYLTLYERITLVKTICPLIIIEKLKQLCGNNLQSCSWQDGNILLSICRNILKLAQTPLIRCEVAALLWLISRTNQNNNIRDKALFYYLIAGNVSPAHYWKILSSSSATQNEMNHGNVLKDTIPAVPNQLPSVKLIQTQFLLLEKIEECNNFISKNLTANPNEDIYALYSSLIKNEDSNKIVKYKFRLQFDESVDSPFQCIFAIKLDITSTTGYQKVKSVSIPSLRKLALNTNGSIGEEIVLGFEVELPRPSTFQVRACFINEDGNCFVTKLNSFNLVFKDIFLPMFKSEDQCTAANIYNAIWNHVENHQKSLKDDHQTCALSVRCIDNIVVPTFLSFFQKYFIIATETASCFGVFLPPGSHILFQLKPLDQVHSVVTMATDDYSLLDETHRFLSDMLQLDSE